jgi:hypothetical protein
MHTRGRSIAVFCAASLIASGVYAEQPVSRAAGQAETKEVLVFVTGSLIPKRVKLSPVGTKTVSPVRIIDRVEIDQTGRHTTVGALANEPSLRVIGH